MHASVRCLLLATLLSGCASAPSTKAPATPEEAVAQRAELRWQALIEARWADAYAFLTPGYREAHTLESYQGNFANAQIEWKAARVTDVNCDLPERCTAGVQVDFEVKGGMAGMAKVESSHRLEETWLLAGDGWHHLPRR